MIINTKKNNQFYLGKEKRKMNSLVKKLGQEHIKCFGCKKGKKLVLIVFWRKIRAPCINLLDYLYNIFIYKAVVGALTKGGIMFNNFINKAIMQSENVLLILIFIVIIVCKNIFSRMIIIKFFISV